MIWREIAANKRASFFLSFLLTLLLAGVGSGVAFFSAPEAWWLGGLAAFAAGVLLWLYTVYRGPKLILSMSYAREASHEENQMLVNVGHEMAIAAGVPMPKIYVIDDSAPNAFATGMQPKSGIICVTTGLLRKLNRDELQGVVAHEIAHIRNYDIRLMATLALTVGLIVLIRDRFFRGWFRWGRRAGSDRGGAQAVIALLFIVLIILAPLFAVLLKVAVSRKREFLADATAAQLTRYPNALADALEKLASDKDELEAANKGTAHMYIVNPFKKLGFMESSSLFSTHPPTYERIRRLKEMGLRGSGRNQDSGLTMMPEIPLRNTDAV